MTQTKFTPDKVRFIAIKYLGYEYKKESINVILSIWLNDYAEQENQINLKDAQVWLALENWAMIKAGKKSKNISIRNYFKKQLTEVQKEEVKTEMNQFDKRAHLIASAFSSKKKGS